MSSSAPNVIFVITDDQGYGDVGCHGNPILRTPYLDRLARESVQLDDHHHDPLCSPSRAALLTGQYAARNGVWHVIHGRHLLSPNAFTMADHFAAAGYRCGMFGKWHLGDNYPFAPQYRGFHESLCHRGGGIGELPDFWGNDYVDDTYFRNGQPEPCHGYCTDVFFGAALDFISADDQAPFFVYLSTNAMHSPFIVPERYAAPYKALGLPDDRASFYGMIANFDENMGRLFAHLKRRRLDENTIVVFTSDHGTAAGYDPASGEGYNAGMRGKKGSVYDGGHRVSFFLRWPGELPAKRVISQLTAHVDILPTLLDLCGIRPAADVRFDGLSLAPLIRGEVAVLPERSIVIQLQPDQPAKWHHTAVLNGRWRLINGDEFYDIQNDPAQSENVMAANAQVSTALRQDYDQWWRDLRQAFSQVIAIPVGAPQTNTVLLSARDWHPTRGRVPWLQEWIDRPEYDAEGYWIIDVVEAGTYEFELRTHPIEAGRPMAADQAVLRIGDHGYTQTTAPSDSQAVFTLDLVAGVTSIYASLFNQVTGRARGAYYVYARRLSSEPDSESIPTHIGRRLLPNARIYSRPLHGKI